MKDKQEPILKLISLVSDRIKDLVDKEDEQEVKRIFWVAYNLLIERHEFSGIENNRDSLWLMQYFLEAVIGQWHYFKLIKSDDFESISTEVIAERAIDRFSLFYKSQTETNISNDNLSFYDARVSTISIAEKYLENINHPLSHINPAFSLINDIFETIFRKVAGFANMLPLGLYSEAFVSWRTLHESECIVKLLINGGDKTRYAYIKHITYNNAYRNQSSFTTEELDDIFAKIKSNMKEHNLKSKDMKKFIEYGWLYEHPKYDPNDVTFKLNFRDGIEKLAELSQYSKIYEGASEIAHSSSAFFYVNNNFCRDLSLSMVYRSFIRIADLYFVFMDKYFKLHPLEASKAKQYLDDTKAMSNYLDKVININEVMQADE